MKSYSVHMIYKNETQETTRTTINLSNPQIANNESVEIKMGTSSRLLLTDRRS